MNKDLVQVGQQHMCRSPSWVFCIFTCLVCMCTLQWLHLELRAGAAFFCWSDFGSCFTLEWESLFVFDICSAWKCWVDTGRPAQWWSWAHACVSPTTATYNEHDTFLHVIHVKPWVVLHFSVHHICLVTSKHSAVSYSVSVRNDYLWRITVRLTSWSWGAEALCRELASGACVSVLVEEVGGRWGPSAAC